MQQIHFIAVGGAVMHNLAICLKNMGHQVTGSDDEIYEPSRSRLAAAGILPAESGWFPEKIHAGLDAIVLGMHARLNNPELIRAQELGLTIYSYPEFIYAHSQNKRRVVVAGSHGKTTTTSMIMHILKYNQLAFDYLVGAQLEGFETMVNLSDAPILIAEGDEYLASPLDLRSKMLLYQPHIAIITGIAWDHINVFPTFESYKAPFETLIENLGTDDALIYNKYDKDLATMLEACQAKRYPYGSLTVEQVQAENKLVAYEDENGQVHAVSDVVLNVFGQHNYANFNAAYLACKALGLSDAQILAALPSFTGAAKRLQKLKSTPEQTIFLDFAHAPSKVKATVNAVAEQFSDSNISAVLELHTFSSINPAFLPHYAESLNAPQIKAAAVFIDEHTFAIKGLPLLDTEAILTAFQRPDLKVFTKVEQLQDWLNEANQKTGVLLLMSSGKLGGLDLKGL